MKTTVDLPDDLVIEAKRYASRYGLTLRAVVENGIRSTLRADEGMQVPFRLRDASVGGSGPQPEFRDETGATMRQAAYGDQRG